MFTKFEEHILTCGYFDVLYWDTDRVELLSKEISHTWIIKKFDKEGYPGVVLYHSHDRKNLSCTFLLQSPGCYACNI